jgi:hypothetical protein
VSLTPAPRSAEGGQTRENRDPAREAREAREGRSDPGTGEHGAAVEHGGAGTAEQAPPALRRQPPVQHNGSNGTPVPAADAARRKPRGGARSRPTGRERHEEKITVYVSAEELIDLEHARLVLRGEHGLAVDRGRIVREAVAVVLADLEQRGEASILVRRLRGR